MSVFSHFLFRSCVMKKSALVAAVLCLVCSFGAQAALAVTITPTVQAFSSELTPYSRQAVHAADGSGLTGNMHSNNPTGTMWTTNGNNFAGGGADYSPSITFNLNALYNVSAMQIWNYNETSY